MNFEEFSNYITAIPSIVKDNSISKDITYLYFDNGNLDINIDSKRRISEVFLNYPGTRQGYRIIADDRSVNKQYYFDQIRLIKKYMDKSLYIAKHSKAVFKFFQTHDYQLLYCSNKKFFDFESKNEMTEMTSQTLIRIE